MRTLLAFLLVAFSASAQVPVMPGGAVPWFKLSNQSFETLASSKLAYRWVMADVADGTVTTWTDRLQSVTFLNNETSKRPSKDASGILIDINHWLTNAPYQITSNCAFGLIFNVVDPSDGNQYHPVILGNVGGASCTIPYSMGFGFYNHSPSFNQLMKAPGCGTDYFTDIGFNRLTNRDCTLVYSQTLTNGDIACYRAYTNGVLAGAYVYTGNTNYFGTSATNINSPTILGRNTYRNSSPKMYVREIWVWTNAPNGTANGSDINPTTLQNFHSYATNTYSFGY